MLEFDWLEFFIYHVIDKKFKRKSHVGVSIGKILISILFKQLLSIKICLGQENKLIRN